MARKLIAVAALVALVSLASAGAALAETYELGKQGGILAEEWSWRHIYSDIKPWDASTEFLGGMPVFSATAGLAWKIGYSSQPGTWVPLINSEEGSHTGPDGNGEGTYTVIFSPKEGENGLRFFFDGSKYTNVPDELKIYSYDAVVTYSVDKYDEQQYGCFAVVKGSFVVTGTNNGGMHFEFIGENLIDSYGNHQNVGYITSATLVYTPLPAGIWLLGTGLLGLACLGRRRRK